MSVYKLDEDQFVVSSNECWIPGVYDSAETAMYAIQFSDEELLRIKSVWQIDGENRSATMDDLKGLK